MRILLVKPHPQLLIAKRLQEGFLHLEPLELEIVAGGVPAEDEVVICDLGIEEKPMEAFHNYLHELNPDIVGFTGYSSQSALVRKLAGIVKEHNPSALNVAAFMRLSFLQTMQWMDVIKAISRGTKYIFALRNIYRDYPPEA